jgi:signal transduction histidine kinase
MFMRTTSIRGKITAGYILSFVFLLLVATMLFVNLLAAEERIASYSGISRFLDTTLEMRRYEKNYLLYGKREDLDAAVQYADSANAQIAGGTVGAKAGPSWLWLGLLAEVDREPMRLEFGPERTSALLHEYRALLRRAGEAKPGGDLSQIAAIETAIREQGRMITQIAERLSSAEGRYIQEMLRSGRRTLIFLVLVFLLGTALIARVVLLTAIRPLKELEIGMQRIASGDFRVLPVASGTDEISSMHTAFNRMIHEVFEHREEMIQSERLASLGTMLAGIAHEINNPLSNISTSAEILREENEERSPEERRELIDQIVSQTDRATDIIRTVLDFSREPRLELRPTNLLATLSASVLLVRGEKPAHVSVKIDVAPDIEILADKTRLQQAFINLMTNAIDAVRNVGREGRIVVSARRAGGEDVEIAFRDSGAGMPRHVVERIFDPFFSTKDVGHGTGLGLYLTHQIVEQHGGTIRVESAVGEGTTVTIKLPASEPASSGAARTDPGS